MDAFTKEHLENWLTKIKFRYDETKNISNARTAIISAVEENPELLNKSWDEILRTTDFVERFESEKPCHDRESIEKAVDCGKLYVRTDAKNNWQVRKVEFDVAGNVKRVNLVFQPLNRFEKVEVLGITNKSFYTLSF